MWRYAVQRLLLIVPVALGVSFVVFSILAITPGDPASIILQGNVTQEDIDRVNRELGFDQPFFRRYFTYIENALFKGDLGTSYQFKTPVIHHVRQRLPISITITMNGLLFSCAIGVPIGVLSAVKQYSLLDTMPTVFALFLAAIPSFWLSMMALLLFCLKLRWFPATGIDTWRHYFMPMIGLGTPYAAQMLRYTRSSMLETIRQDYIRTARAKGATESTVIWKHAMKNALLPVITIIGINFSVIIGGAIATETLFAIPGIGTMIVTAIKMKDMPMVMGGVMSLSITCSLVMLAVDLLYALVDPRIRAKYSTSRMV